MFVRQYLIPGFIILFTSVHALMAQDQGLIDDDAISTDLKELNEQMEMILNEDNIEQLLNFYHKDAYLLIPGETFHGKGDILDYWQQMKDTEITGLEVVEVENEERNIYRSEYYKALASKPPGWRQRGIELDENKPLVYELGRVNVQRKNEEGTTERKETDRFIVWQVQPDGDYRILVDSFSWK